MAQPEPYLAIRPVKHRLGIQNGLGGPGNPRRDGVCRNGHPIRGPEDLYVRPGQSKTPKGECRACRYEHQGEWRALDIARRRGVYARTFGEAS